MSNAILTNPVGLKIEVSKKPSFSTLINRAVSGMESRLGLMAYPLWEFSLAYEFLRDMAAFNELENLVGFFVQRRGSLDSFLYTDPQDSSVTDQSIGTGDGANKNFQLQRAWGGFNEPVHNVNAITNVKVNGSATTAYTINSTGLITFTTAPANTAIVTWSGTYYYRCRFSADELEASQMLKDLWELKKLQFIGSTMNKV